MTTLILKLPEKLDEQLKILAKRQGRDAASLSLDILEKSLDATVPMPNPHNRPYEEWRRDFLEWANSRPKIDVVVDDSRETIYEGR